MIPTSFRINGTERGNEQNTWLRPGWKIQPTKMATAQTLNKSVVSWIARSNECACDLSTIACGVWSLIIDQAM